MVGKRESKTEEVQSDYFKYLKQNNKSLAKALTEERITSKQLLDDRNYLQKKLNAAMLLNVRYEKILNQLLAESKHTLPVCNAMLAHIAQLIKLSSEGINLPKTLDYDLKEKNLFSSNSSNRSISPGVTNKTHAVKPMVSGHVIFRPTINLWRLSDVDNADLTRNVGAVELRVSNTEEPTTSTPNNINNFTPETRPIPGLRASLYDEDAQDEDISSADLEIEPNLMEESMVERPEPLDPVEELTEESENEDNQEPVNLNTEPRIVIDPLPAATIERLSNISNNSKRKSSGTYHEDPLEGPSTLLDENGHYVQSRYVSKPRAANLSSTSSVNKQKYFYDSDSSSEDEHKQKQIQKRNSRMVTKRKGTYTNKTHDSEGNKKPLKKKLKKNQTPAEDKSKKTNENNLNSSVTTNNHEHISLSPLPVVVLTRQNLSSHDFSFLINGVDETSPNISTDDTSFSDHPRPRRNKLKGSLKELSLRSKLRRDK